MVIMDNIVDDLFLEYIDKYNMVYKQRYGVYGIYYLDIDIYYCTFGDTLMISYSSVNHSVNSESLNSDIDKLINRLSKFGIDMIKKNIYYINSYHIQLIKVK